MADQLIYSDVLVDNSITNPLVESNNALDNTSPLSFLDYLKHTNGTYVPAEYNKFYTSYLRKWSNEKNDITPTNIFVAEQYAELLKDISLNGVVTCCQFFIFILLRGKFFLKVYPLSNTAIP